MADSHQLAFAAWRDHTSAKREEIESSVHASLVDAYPDHHITRTNASKCNVLGYAAAGHAVVTPQDEPGYEATRVYRASRSRLDGATGKLEDVVNFGKWHLQYKSSEFIVFELTYMDQRSYEIKKIQYILAPRSTAHIDGLHHIRVDDLLLASGIWTKDAHEEVWVYEDAHWSKNSALWQAVQGTTWDDVVLEPAMRAKLHRDIYGFFDNRELYRRARIPWKRGIIFHGVPGNGKSMTLAVTINELAKRDPPIPTLYIKSLDACSGPKWSLQEIFKKARKTAPCLLVCEDLDSLVTDNTRSYFLNEVDGLASNDGILIIGSTNHLDRLDTAVTKRPSRFDRKYHFRLPGEAERLAYCRHWRGKFADSDLVDFPDDLCTVIAQWTVGYSFAYLKELFVTALLMLSHGEEGEDAEDEKGAGDGNLDSAKAFEANGVQTNGTDSSTEDSEKATKPSDQPKVSHTSDAATSPPSSDGREKDEKPKPRTLPEVDVPSSLEQNALMKIFRTQAHSLLQEMDHEADSRSAKPPGSGEPPIRYRFPDLLDDNDD